MTALGVGAATTRAERIDLRLEVEYAGGAPDAGGVWTLFARSDRQGIFSLQTVLLGVEPAITWRAPVGRVNGSAVDNAGFATTVASGVAGGQRLTAAQVFTPQGQGEQGLFYGVGTLDRGAPNYAGRPPGTSFLGPNIATLTAVRNVPWGDDDPLWATGVSIASGTFVEGAEPRFGAESAQVFVFTGLGTAVTPGAIAAAIDFTTLVATNLDPALAADFNGDGRVDLVDLDILGQNFGATGVGRPQGDTNGDGTVDLVDLDTLGQQFGAGTAVATPEPAGVLLVGAMLACGASGRRARSPRG